MHDSLPSGYLTSLGMTLCSVSRAIVLIFDFTFGLWGISQSMLHDYSKTLRVKTRDFLGFKSGNIWRMVRQIREKKVPK